MMGWMKGVWALTAIAMSVTAGAVDAGMREIGPVRWFSTQELTQETPYAVSVEGEELPLAPAGHIEPAYYVQFQVTEPFTLNIQADLPEGCRLNLQPARYREDLWEEEETFALAIDGPGPRVLMMETEDGRRHTPLIILAEPERTWEPPTAEGVFLDVSDLADAAEPQTGPLQEALDACAEDGGVVFFGPGVYRTGGLRVGSNTKVFLAPGALIQADAETEDHPRELILFDEAENSGLAGPGVIDGNGHRIRGAEGEVSVTLLRMKNSRNVYLRDVMLRNAAGWTGHIIGCEDVMVEDVRVIGDWGVPNTDGINPDNARNVRMTGMFIYAGDDPVAVKATNRYGIDAPCEDVEIRQSMVMTLKTALKLGTESRQDIRNVLFEDIDVIHSSRGIALWMRDGYRFSDVVFRDIRMDLLEFEGENMSGEPFRFCIQERDGVGAIENVLAENIDVSAPYRAVFTGRPDGGFQDIILRGVTWRLTPCHIKTDPRPLTDAWVVDPANELPLEGNPLVVIHRVDGLAFEDVTIDWRDAGEDTWDRFVEQRESANIRLDGVTHEGYPFGEN